MYASNRIAMFANGVCFIKPFRNFRRYLRHTLILAGYGPWPRQKLMDWMMEDGYWKLKEKAQHRE